MLQIALLAPPGVQAGSLYGAFDILSVTGCTWSMVDGTPPSPLFDTRIVGRATSGVRGSGGVAVHPTAAFRDAETADIVYIPAITFDLSEPIEEAYGPELAYVAERHGAGALIASACSGSMLVAATGLLDGSEATTHWAFAGLFRQLFPDVRLCEDQVFIASGDGDRVLSAGGGTARSTSRASRRACF